MEARLAGGGPMERTGHGDRLDPAFAQGLLDVASINTEVLEIWSIRPIFSKVQVLGDRCLESNGHLK